MKILIVEDEPIAANKLERMVRAKEPEVVVLDKLDTVSSAVDFFKTGKESPDLVFMDVRLADGLSFDIFDQVEVDYPIVFTTAYDDYALPAFKVNSVDYLLKPINEEALGMALEKYKKRHAITEKIGLEEIDALRSVMSERRNKKKYKERFVVRAGEKLRSVRADNAVCFYSESRVTFLRDSEGRNHVVDYTLEQVENAVDPDLFFRVNRKFLVGIDGIGEVVFYSNSRLRIMLDGFEQAEVIVSRERVSDFKEWFGQ
ncbi:DNA-binding response regulator [Fulvitalea axinellae]|uniref:DNA-binding response regulator n=1 Tax=Fulvitalea axinellae TaxID=1182444 RepID=A0AAU9CN30_9BACT|nr:DNA-binding response regulator [Fulvitalea axinellae]